MDACGNGIQSGKYWAARRGKVSDLALVGHSRKHEETAQPRVACEA